MPSRSTAPLATRWIAAGQVSVYRNTPVTVISRFAIWLTGSAYSSAPMPTSTTCPAGPTALMPLTTAPGTPVASTNASTGSIAVTSTAAGSSTSVAPNRSAFSRRDATRSVTTMRAAPKARGACAQMTPIGPAPAMSMDDPGTTGGWGIVAIATDSGSSSAAASSDTESGTGWAMSSSISTYRQNAPSMGGVA